MTRPQKTNTAYYQVKIRNYLMHLLSKAQGYFDVADNRVEVCASEEDAKELEDVAREIDGIPRIIKNKAVVFPKLSLQG